MANCLCVLWVLVAPQQQILFEPRINIWLDCVINCPFNVMTLDRWVDFVRMVDAWGVHAKQTCSARRASNSRWNRDNIKRSCYRLVGRHGGFVSTFQSSFLVAPAESRATYLFTLVSVCLVAWLWHSISSIATRWLKKFQFNFNYWQ